jgi:hypothetical protein
MNKLEGKITAYKVSGGTPPIQVNPATKPIEREEVITGVTYKTKIQDHTYYITINDIVREGTRHPYEIFINSKNVSNYAKLTVLTRLISAFFRTGFPYTFIAEELKQIIDPTGGYFKKGRRYESLEAELGEILEKHFNFLKESI